jgi:endonuclease YncB( thermonuclease family)
VPLLPQRTVTGHRPPCVFEPTRHSHLIVPPVLPATSPGSPAVYRVARVADGDTLTLANGQRVRLV